LQDLLKTLFNPFLGISLSINEDTVQEKIKAILEKCRIIAVVGLSDQMSKPSHHVGAYLKQHGYKVIPVNPTIDEVLGLKSYRSLLDIPVEIQKTIDIVNIFRKAQDVPPIVNQAIELKTKFGRPFVVWMQEDIVNDAAAETARKAGFEVVMDKCIMKEHQQLGKG
jgi:uncharacterized protein